MKFGMEIMVHGVINGLLKLESSVTIGPHQHKSKREWQKEELKWVITDSVVE